jgi:hypothetical protein
MMLEHFKFYIDSPKSRERLINSGYGDIILFYNRRLSNQKYFYDPLTIQPLEQGFNRKKNLLTFEVQNMIQ